MSRPQGTSTVGRIMPMKNSKNETSIFRTVAFSKWQPLIISTAGREMFVSCTRSMWKHAQTKVEKTKLWADTLANVHQTTRRHIPEYGTHHATKLVATKIIGINPLTPELNPSAQRCLARFLLGILFLEPWISLTYAWKTNKCNNYSFSLLITCGISYMFRHYSTILRERS
jgi:hypothetical protein